MTEKNGVAQLYTDFCHFVSDTGHNGFANYFQRAVRSSPSTFSIFEKYVERRVDMEWVEMMENAIVPLDNIIRKPNSFIKREEDVIPIAQAHEISQESVRHLAQHTSLISSVKKGRVTPSRILSVSKDDSLETYENRFIVTLIKQASYFLDKRMKVLMKDTRVADQFNYHVDGNCQVGADKFTYNLDMRLESPHEEVADEALINADVSNMTSLQRVERLRKIFYTFQGSLMFRTLSTVADVRPPLVLTNVLRKNPNFVAAVSLWNFMNSYTKTGYSTEDVEEFRVPTEEDKLELYALIMLEYAIAKKRGAVADESAEEQETYGETAEVQVATPPSIVKNAVDSLCDTFDLTVDEVRRVYEKELKKKEKKRDAELTKARGIFERALETERDVDREAEILRHINLQEELRRRLKLALYDEDMAFRAKQPDEIARPFAYRYRFSFMARLIQSGDPLQHYYTELKNFVLSYKKVKGRMAWGYERFALGKSSIFKMVGRGKSLTLTLALPNEAFEVEKYRLTDLRETTKNEYTAKFRVSSERALKYAKELIAMRMAELGAEIGDVPTTDYHYPYQSTENLLKTNPPLVKRVESKDGANAGTIVTAYSENQDEMSRFIYKYRYSFKARLIQSGEPIQTYYTELKNYLLSYNKVKPHMSWGYERFSWGKEQIVKIKGKGMALSLSFAISPTVFEETRYHLKDIRGDAEDGDDVFTAMLKVTSERALGYAKELIDIRMAELGVMQGAIPTVDYHLPYISTEKMLDLDPPLAKRVETRTRLRADEQTLAPGETLASRAEAEEEEAKAEELAKAEEEKRKAAELERAADLARAAAELAGAAANLAKAAAEKAQAETDGESDDEDDEEGDEVIVDPTLDTFHYQYRYSFKARLIQSGEPMQSYYTELKNHLLSYKKVKPHMSWGYERFSWGKEQIVKIKGKGKALSLFLSVPDEAFEDPRYHLQNLAEEGKDVVFNTKFRVTSDRALKYAKEIIDLRMKALGVEQGEVPKVDYRLPFMTVAELLELPSPLVRRAEARARVRLEDGTADAPTAENIAKESEITALPAKGESAKEEAAKTELPADAPTAENESVPADENVPEGTDGEAQNAPQSDAEDEEGGSDESGTEEVETVSVIDEKTGELQTFSYKYRFSFQANLIRGGEPIQTYYTAIKNHLLSYKKVKPHMSWGYERFSLGREQIVKIKGKGRILSLLLVLPAEAFENPRYHVKDLRQEGEEVVFNAKFRVTSDRALKYALELLDMRMATLPTAQEEVPAVDYKRPYMTVAEMLQTEPPLVKLAEARSRVRVEAETEKAEPVNSEEKTGELTENPTEQAEPAVDPSQSAEDVAIPAAASVETAQTAVEEAENAVQDAAETANEAKTDVSPDAETEDKHASFFGRLFGKRQKPKENDKNTKG